VVGSIRFIAGGVLTDDVGLRRAGDDDPLTRLVIVSTTFASVAGLEQTLPQLVMVERNDVQVTSSTELEAALRSLAGRVGAFGREVTLASIAVGALFLSLIVFATLQGRRRDLGRRRALGASRGAIVGMAIAQTLVTAIPGAVIGGLAGAGALRAATGLLPSLGFMTGVAVLGSMASACAASVPAVIAAHRDPVAALRVP
jgi:putative ABC transport system permease protein